MPSSLVSRRRETHPAKARYLPCAIPYRRGVYLLTFSPEPGGMERQLCTVENACERGTGPLELFEMLSERMRRVVPFDGGAWFSIDPSAILPTQPVRIENIEAGHCESYWEREATVEDV